MPIQQYKSIRFSVERREIIRKALSIVTSYAQQGYSLTLRQLYYQMISRDWFPESWADPQTGSTNNERSYKKLGDIISDARLAGLVDWEAIEDRTRELGGTAHWACPADIISDVSKQFRIDKWEDQPYRVEVWVEKDALEGIVAKAARALDINFFSCRGYASMTSIWNAGQRLKEYCLDGQIPVILHLGDHDPSGIDMSRDIEERVKLFMDGCGDTLVFDRIALNMPQVRQYNPPPNPAKVTDSRFRNYQALHGDDSWELDALDPVVIDALIHDHVNQYVDGLKFRLRQNDEAAHRKDLAKAALLWPGAITNLLQGPTQE